jgi:hypothetical protein
MICGECSLDPEVTGRATATDNCGELVWGGEVESFDVNNPPQDYWGKVVYFDSSKPDLSSCPWMVKRTWAAIDGCGNAADGEQKITCVPDLDVQVTDSSLCNFDVEPGGCQNFRLLFTKEPKVRGCYKLTASNPGQTYFNVMIQGAPGVPLAFTMYIPYPYVTQGAVPLHAYDSVSLDDYGCYVPGNSIPVTIIGKVPFTLSDYAGGYYAVMVQVTPDAEGDGFVYVNLHLDYGLKKGTGSYAPDPSGDGDALRCNTSDVAIPNRGTYRFSAEIGAQTLSDEVCNINVFK